MVTLRTAGAQRTTSVSLTATGLRPDVVQLQDRLHMGAAAYLLQGSYYDTKAFEGWPKGERRGHAWFIFETHVGVEL